MDNQENSQSKANLEEALEHSEVVSDVSSNSKPAVKENKFKTIVPFLILGVVAVLLGVAMVYAYNLANDNDMKEAETPTNSNTQNTVVEEEPIVEEENLNPEEDMLDSAVEEIDNTISTLDEETTFNDMDTAEFGF